MQSETYYRPPDKGADTLQGLPETKTKKPYQAMSELKIVPLSALAAKENEDKISAVEGVLATLYEAKTGTTQAGKDWSLQDGVLKDGEYEHKVCFASPENVQPMSMKGKRIRISSHVGEKGMSGVYMKEQTYTANKGPNAGKEVTTRKIHVTASATIEVVGASGQPTTQASAPARQGNSATGAQAADSPNEGEPMTTNEPMECRIADWMRTFYLVCAATGRDPKQILAEATPDKVIEMTTGFICSFKGRYNTHAAPHFLQSTEGLEAGQGALLGKSRAVTRELEADGELDSPGTTSGESVTTWRDYQYKGVRLEDYEPEKLAGLVGWAYEKASEELSPEASTLRSHLLIAGAELATPASKKLSGMLAKSGLGVSFDEGEVDEVCVESYGAKFEDLNYAQLYDLSTNYAEMVDAMKQKWQAKQKPAVKKPAVKRPASNDLPD